MSDTLTFDRFVEIIKTGAGDVGRTFKTANDDWQAMFFTGNPADMDVHQLEDEWFGDGFTKDALCAVIPLIAERAKAVWGAFILSTWYAHTSIDGPDAELIQAAIREHGVVGLANKKEMLCLYAYDGLAQKAYFWGAEIVRSPDAPPTLAEWKPWETSGPNAMTGRFVEALEEAFA